MNLRRREQSVLSNPILIGALTVLVTIVAVALAYNANNGLPFVPKYTLHVQLSDASEVTHGAEVHMGGTLVGLVNSITPSRDSAGQPIAMMDLKLDKTVEPLPVDSTFDVRLKGAIGLKYLQVTKGTSIQTYPNGATVPMAQTGSEVDLDQFLSMFDPATRAGVAKSTNGFSDALAGRGSGINDAIGAFVPLVTDLGPVARNLASHEANLGGFFRGLESFSRALAPVAQTQADLYTNLDTTFTSFASVAVPFLQEWISQTPPTFSTVIADSPREQAFVNDTAGLFRDLRPGFATLRQSAPVLADAFAIGTRTLPGTTKLDARLLSLAKHLQAYGQTPTVTAGLNRLTLTAKNLRSPLSYLAPVQSSCNYVTLFLRNIASTLSDDVSSGTALRFNLVAIDDKLGSQGVPSQAPSLAPDHSPGAENGPLHVNAYPNTDSPGQKPPECASGNEPYSGNAALIGNPPGNVGLKTEKTTRPAG
jgi:ABC-type transporter Mla subunit MlaD